MTGSSSCGRFAPSACRAFRAAPGWRRSGLSPRGAIYLALRRRLRVVQANAAELERRTRHAVPERPEVRNEAKLDAGLGVEPEEVSELDHLDRGRPARGSASSHRPPGRARTCPPAGDMRRPARLEFARANHPRRNARAPSRRAARHLPASCRAPPRTSRGDTRAGTSRGAGAACPPPTRAAPRPTLSD